MLTKQEKSGWRSGRNAPNIVILVRIGLAIMNCALLVVPEACTGCLFVQTTATPPSLRREWRWSLQTERNPVSNTTMIALTVMLVTALTIVMVTITDLALRLHAAG